MELDSLKSAGGGVSAPGVDVTDLTEELEKAKTAVVSLSDELAEVKEELVGALSRESKLVDDISTLANEKDEFETNGSEEDSCDKCDDAAEEIDMLKKNESKLHDENEDLLKQLEESLNDNAEMLGRIKILKEEVKNLRMEDADTNKGVVDEDVKAEYEALKRRLGSEEYKFLATSSVSAVVESMAEDTNFFHDSFLAKEMNQVEQLKFLLALSNDLVPSIKHILYKNLLSGDTPVQRVCVEKFLAGLCSFDKGQKVLLKEVTVNVLKASNENTPGNGSKVIVPDPSLDGLEIEAYLNKNNKGCKVINYGGLVLIAATRNSHVNTKHTAALDVNNRPMEQRCPIQSCKQVYVHGVTDIAPMTVVGPLMHNYIGKEQWVCVKHWRQCRGCFR